MEVQGNTPKYSAYYFGQRGFDGQSKAKATPEAIDQRGLQSCTAHTLHARPLKGCTNLRRFLRHPLALSYVKYGSIRCSPPALNKIHQCRAITLCFPKALS